MANMNQWNAMGLANNLLQQGSGSGYGPKHSGLNLVSSGLLGNSQNMGALSLLGGLLGGGSSTQLNPVEQQKPDASQGAGAAGDAGGLGGLGGIGGISGMGALPLIYKLLNGGR